jgi:hypothetical protein
LILLSVGLAGGFRPGQPVVLVAPSLFALVLAVLFIGVLVQGGAFDPLRLMNGARPPLANTNGIVVMATLFLAGAQVFSMLTPDAGLPRLLFSLYFLVLMFHTMAAGPDRVRLLRSLCVTFGAAFVLKFIVLDALSSPSESRVGRAMQVLFDGVTLGAITQRLQHPAAGYIAFATVAAFLIAVWMLPARQLVGDQLLVSSGEGLEGRRARTSFR